jgi:hypothetical protein
VSQRRGDLLRRPPPVRGDVQPTKAAPTALPTAERAFFQQRLGQDFSHVRVHNDETAAATATGLGAKAFTVGSDIAFAADRYRPGTTAGRRVLAHELVHVAQQARGGGNGRASAETRASAAAERIVAGQSVTPAQQGGAAPGLYCDPDDKKKLDAPTAAPTAAATALPKLTLTPPSSLTPPPAFSPLSPAPLLPLPPPLHLMSNAEILAPFATHGTTPSTMGMNIQDDWAHAYRTFRNYMSESLAVASANMFLPAAYGASLAFNTPNVADKSDTDFKAAFPKDLRLPPIPLVSSSTLTTLYEAITKKRNTHAFYF